MWRLVSPALESRGLGCWDVDVARVPTAMMNKFAVAVVLKKKKKRKEEEEKAQDLSCFISPHAHGKLFRTLALSNSQWYTAVRPGYATE